MNYDELPMGISPTQFKKVCDELDALRAENDSLLRIINTAVATIQAERDAARLPENHIRLPDGRDVKVLGTLPMTADGCVVGFPPGFGSLWGKGRHIGIDRFDPVCMWYDNQSRLIMLRTIGGHGGIDFDGQPVGSLYSTREAAEAARDSTHA